MVNILHMGSIQAGLETSCINWMKDVSDKYDFEFFLPSARPIPNNRNQITKKFLKGNWDILFMIDDDTVPLSNPFKILEHNKDVCAGVYPGRGDTGFHFHVYKLGDNYPEKIFFKHFPPEERVGLKKVDAVATGCMAVKRHVLEKMIEKGMAPFEDMFDKEGVLITNDDMAFCLKCRELGIEVYADWDVVCDHIKNVSILEVLRFIEHAAKTGKPIISMSGEDFKAHIV